MASTIYVQFFKGALLLIMSIVVVIYVLTQGLSTSPMNNGQPYHDFKTLQADAALNISEAGYSVVAGLESEYGKAGFIKLAKDEIGRAHV